MNKFLLILITILLSIAAVQAQNNGLNLKWREFESLDGKFKILFPGSSTRSVKETGGVENVKYEFSTTTPDILFRVSYMDTNFPKMNKDELKTHYDKMRAPYSYMPNIKLLSDRDVWTSEKLGREFTLENAARIIKNRNFLVGNRLYQVFASAPPASLQNDEVQKAIDKFLDSFQLIEK